MPASSISPWTPLPGVKNATQSDPGTFTVMDPFHCRHLVGTKLHETNWRLQTELHSRRGQSDDDLCGIRKTIHSRASLLTEKQKYPLNYVFGAANRAALVACWRFDQDKIKAYAAPPKKGRAVMVELIARLAATIADELKEPAGNVPTQACRYPGVFRRSRAVEWTYGRVQRQLEHLRGIALGFCTGATT